MINIPENIETENARVQFLVAISTAMAAKARIQLKTKNLYAADGRAVKELLKIAKTLQT
jgi:clusterin-associated protein 1